MAFAIAGLTNAPVLPLSLDLCIESYVVLSMDFLSIRFRSVILELIQLPKRLSQVFSWMRGKRKSNSIRLIKTIFSSSQFGSVLAISILPFFTQAPTTHQMNIQKCVGKDGK